MNRKVLALVGVACLSGSLLTACGQVDDDGTARVNNVNGYQQNRNGGFMNRDGILNNGADRGMLDNPFDGNGNRNYGVDGGRDVGANGAGVSGSSDDFGSGGMGIGNNRGMGIGNNR
ncbi:hypothetical protein FE782_17460 [Paenibacillus antri]|uniref:Uncharacterized protein n=1 Tax=Paenibacillus antri TaxID=2582848 RepID=A0A5R9G9T3_9BACL|nr:hypothetical protein [Paenibacillus antri]TLS50840.1 hypothetical protein FE782_17460 [Paenibacillus antri]